MSSEVVVLPITKGLETIVDHDVIGALPTLRWQAVAKGRTWYVSTNIGGGRRVYLHRFIMNPPPGLHVDHIDGNGLNNQRANLRLATVAQNRRNVHFSWTASGFKGVYLDRRGRGPGRWWASIGVDNRTIRLGTFDTAEDAARAYNVAAIHHFGEFAHLNTVTAHV